MGSSLSIRRRAAFVVVMVSAILAASILAGCTKSTSNKTPAESVQGLLRLRLEKETDKAAYLRHVESTSTAEAIAAASRTATEVPLPAWNAPEVTSETTFSAEVLVKWKPDERFKGWPKSTIFLLRKIEGGWRVVDASDATSSTPPANR